MISVPMTAEYWAAFKILPAALFNMFDVSRAGVSFSAFEIEIKSDRGLTALAHELGVAVGRVSRWAPRDALDNVTPDQVTALRALLPLYEQVMTHYRAAKGNTKIVRFARMERLQNTTSGNPRYRIFTTDGDVYVTKDDAALVYHTYHTGVRYEITLATAGRETRMTHAVALDPETDQATIIYV